MEGVSETTQEPTSTAPESTPSGPSAGGAPEPSRLDSLIGDRLPAPAANQGQKGPQEPGAAGTSPTGGQAAEPAAAGQPAPASTAPKTYKVRGKDYSLEQLVEAGLLEDALTTLEQHRHLQGKYQELLEKQSQTAQQPGQQPPGQPKPQGINQAQVRAAYATQIPEIVKAGYLEEDFTALYPDATAQMLMHRDMLYELRQVVQGLVQSQGQLAGRSQAQDTMGWLTGQLDELAGKGQHFEALKSPEARGAFVEYLKALNPYQAQVTPDFLAQQWFAHNHEQILAATAKVQADQAAQAAEARRQAAGDGKAARPGAPPPAPAPTLMDSLIGDRLPVRR